MIPSTIIIDIPMHQPADHENQLPTFFRVAYNFVSNYIFTLAAAAFHGGLVAPSRHLWVHCYPIVAFMEERVVMPPSALGFIINILIAFAEIKAQGQPEFPFETHPRHIRLSVASVIMYGLACAIQLVVSAFGLHGTTSVFVVTARLGKISSLCLLAASLACLFLF
ncbi:hypothetical protein QVD17_28148 [Tagetes erecta]|uniref:Uncharacterized protein n=1 Tax=Tagetes erecta TaxID=13708 RepID=A0AAD8KA85_TARER|nr:hypothetical protein QVD17_28148 [Tagetes erecta]